MGTSDPVKRRLVYNTLFTPVPVVSPLVGPHFPGAPMSWSVLPRAASAGLVLWALAMTPASGQDVCGSASSSVQMQTLMEKTIFNVDVLWLTLQLRGLAGERLQEIRDRHTLTDEIADSVAHVAVDAECAVAQIDFVRDISRDRFLDGLRDSTRKAWEAGLLDEETFRFIEEASSEWYPFLRERGVMDGDQMTYRIRGDTLKIEYRSPDGELLLDQTDVGPGRTRSVLAGYFAPGSDFRDGLMEALFREEEAASDPEARDEGFRDEASLDGASRDEAFGDGVFGDRVSLDGAPRR